jgi:hypothetical protein
MVCWTWFFLCVALNLIWECHKHRERRGYFFKSDNKGYSSTPTAWRGFDGPLQMQSNGKRLFLIVLLDVKLLIKILFSYSLRCKIELWTFFFKEWTFFESVNLLVWRSWIIFQNSCFFDPVTFLWTSWKFIWAMKIFKTHEYFVYNSQTFFEPVIFSKTLSLFFKNMTLRT